MQHVCALCLSQSKRWVDGQMVFRWSQQPVVILLVLPNDSGSVCPRVILGLQLSVYSQRMWFSRILFFKNVRHTATPVYFYRAKVCGHKILEEKTLLLFLILFARHHLAISTILSVYLIFMVDHETMTLNTACVDQPF